MAKVTKLEMTESSDAVAESEKAIGLLQSAAADVKSAASALASSARISRFLDGTPCPIYYDDEIYPVLLPFADFEQYQLRLAESRQPADPLMLRQLTDLVPSLGGRGLVDVGGFTGHLAAIIARLLGAGKLHVFEPQKVVWDTLCATISANGLDDIAVLSQDVIGEEGQKVQIGATRPDRLAETSYLRRETGKMISRSLDALDLGDVGMVNLDYNDSKIPALRGMAGLIERCKPVIMLDLMGRDINEVDAFLKERKYVMVRAGRNAAIFLPG